ncbi:polyamine ABC transporter substrate-binding protein [Rhizobium etli]|uniref:polyamine ABC transporter substrate-binding protein n=1 Tax=Rhizobium etli TaxID=29449 RepID=UPI00041C4D90|nr:ABC transporter substrate-binding protein [Rhizobium etli]
MMTTTMRLAFGAALLAALPSIAQSGEIPDNLKGTGELVVIGGTGSAFDNAVKKAWLDPFMRDTGIKVVTAPVENAALLTSIKVGQPIADTTFISGGEIPGWVAKGFIDKIDYSFFSKETLAAIPEEARTEYAFRSHTYSVVPTYSTKKYPDGTKHPENWKDIYDVVKFPGKRALPNCGNILHGALLEGALMGDGVPPEKLYPLDLDRAFAKVKEIAPNVGRWWGWDAGGLAPQALIDGEADMGSAWNGRIINLRKEGAPVALSWDQSLLQHDDWVIVKNSPNKENAAKFLAYIARPEAQAAFAEAIPYGVPNKDAYKLLPKELVANLPGAPGVAEKQVTQNYDWWEETRSDGRTNLDYAIERCQAVLAQ